MQKFQVVINSKLELKWGEEIYKTIVQGSNNKNLLISVPVVNGVYLTFRTGEEISLVYYDNKANIFSFSCKIINRITENGIPYYSTSLPYNITKVQRRNYVRVDTVQVIKSIIKYNEESKSIVGDKFSNGLLLDLSGGGMRIKLKEKLRYSDVIMANIGNGAEELSVKGRIVRVDRSEDKRYVYGISFLELDNRTREKIIGMVFKIMRKQRELQ